MTILPQLVAPGIRRHVTQCDNGRQQTFFEEGTFALHLGLLADAADKARAEVWAISPERNDVTAT